ncbi:hypothetical protein HJC23_011823 [Cyclotella cryptica]|uniref:Uncharacterized protein n=1 Tax=Cyclotella cryptica TaxID=29204 RepID=A0ABD3NWC4_9STRA|eukprot:CCRYP_019325-RA/>CCRYP_019325-RA protein AED:0.24 eAED:0.24 QI:0/-1/0/1/-1/1/1/0/294
MKISSLSFASIPMVTAFAPGANHAAVKHSNLNAEAAALTNPSKPLFDPLGLYPENSPERMAGLILPLETDFGRDTSKEVTDPLRLYSDQSQLSKGIEMSPSLPFVPRPALLDGTLPGDRGFDPFNFSSDSNALQWQRRAEIKHARLAMLAAVGWPVAELLHTKIATAIGLPVLLASGDRVPSVLNDGLSHAAFPVFWIGAVAAAAAFEICEVIEDNVSCKLNPGDMGFDPLNLGGKRDQRKHFMSEAELFNGRLGMLAITGFAVQEWFLNNAVVNQIPIFFKPINVALEQLMGN